MKTTEWCVYLIVLWLGYYEPTRLQLLEFSPDLKASQEKVGKYDTLWLDQQPYLSDTVHSYSLFGKVIERGKWNCIDTCSRIPKMTKDPQGGGEL